MFKEFKLKEVIKFVNFNAEPNLKYVLEKDGSFYHENSLCGNGKCGQSKLYKIHNLLWGKPFGGDFIYKFFINEAGKICAPYPGKDFNYPCSKESIEE
ncbi:hypothetical protein HGB47_15395 [Leptospira yasudae]|uniref:hypothetical protein n=1 Tax=Leptospira yasudae TaxID=2202201 RepID=UPI001C50125B|nr:hypothetical protein [Leptospira yasudae]MBW0434998.1 hypothetical protein [Leptospira yasudae]